MSATEPIKDREQLRSIETYFLENKKYRDHAMFVLGIHTTLRISDLLRLRWSEVYDESHNQFYSHITVTEHKTGKRKRIAMNIKAIEALRLLLPNKKSDWVFESRNGGNAPISRQQAWRIMEDAYAAVGITDKIACHGLRKTWGYHAWTEANVSPVIIMEAYNHSSYDVTKRYLGVAQDDLDKAYLEMNLF